MFQYNCISSLCLFLLLPPEILPLLCHLWDRLFHILAHSSLSYFLFIAAPAYDHSSDLCFRESLKKPQKALFGVWLPVSIRVNVVKIICSWKMDILQHTVCKYNCLKLLNIVQLLFFSFSCLTVFAVLLFEKLNQKLYNKESRLSWILNWNL